MYKLDGDFCSFVCSQIEFESHHLGFSISEDIEQSRNLFGNGFCLFLFFLNKIMVRIKCNKVWNSFELVIILRGFREVGMPLMELLREGGREEG